MSAFTYIAFQRPLPAYRFGDIKGREKEFGIMYDINSIRNNQLYLFPGSSREALCIIDKASATFNRCFVNTYIYEFATNHRGLGDVSDSIYQEVLASGKSHEFCKSRTTRIELCDFIRKYAASGETVEIYEEFGDHRNFNFGPPARKLSFALFEYIVEYDDTRFSDYFAEVDKTKISLLVE